MNTHLAMFSILNEENTIEKLRLRRASIASLECRTVSYKAEVLALTDEIVEREGILFAFMRTTTTQYPVIGLADEQEETDGEEFSKRA